MLFELATQQFERKEMTEQAIGIVLFSAPSAYINTNGLISHSFFKK